MLDHRDRADLQALLELAEPADSALSQAELEGFLYALIITPQMIPPSEWLPVIFGGELPEFRDLKQADDCLGGVLRVYDKLVGLRDAQGLQFPFDLDNLRPGEIDAIQDWALGFLEGLSLRGQYWFRHECDRPVTDDDEELATSLAVVHAVANPEEAADLFELAEDDMHAESPGDEAETRLLAKLYFMLPHAIVQLQDFAAVHDDPAPTPPPPSRPHMVYRIGRNEPCPCGSGLKYKKCCGGPGSGGQTLH